MSGFGGGGRILGGWLKRRIEELFECCVQMLSGFVVVVLSFGAGSLIGSFSQQLCEAFTYRKRQMVIFLGDGLYQNGRKAPQSSYSDEYELTALKRKQASRC